MDCRRIIDIPGPGVYCFRQGGIPMNRETITLSLVEHSYDIVLEPGCLSNAGSLLNLNRKVLVVTDSGVPESYADTVAASALAAEVVRIPEGESSKSFDNYRLLLRRMLALGMGRGDCVAAVGGGVVGDLSGFAAACYMRGIDFYNIPTTVLSQVDSSIGGKTAIDLDGIKNVVGAFYQPRCVLVDPATLSTLPRRQIANGLAEAVKMALCFDQEAFARFEALDFEAELNSLASGKPSPGLVRIISDALHLKKKVVEEDEKEQGLRRVLNFGHTLGHGIESVGSKNGMLHGECVALGMMKVIRNAGLTERIIQKNLNEAALAQLYEQAAALIYPSLYEGFGIPILEAFSRGLPVLLSDRSCFPEIAGNAALYFDPENADSIAGAVRRILAEPELRQELVRRGNLRLKDFSWEKSALELLEIYRQYI